jgi:hypothetical protein
MLILDSLVAAADEMANPRKAPRLAAAGPVSTPKLKRSPGESARLLLLLMMPVLLLT